MTVLAVRDSIVQVEGHSTVFLMAENSSVALQAGDYSVVLFTDCFGLVAWENSVVVLQEDLLLFWEYDIQFSISPVIGRCTIVHVARSNFVLMG
jgi:hypothetical protein